MSAAGPTTDGCGAPLGGAALSGVDLSKEAVITGVVRRADEPVGGAYVRLLDASGEFTAEVPTGADGVFRFFAGPGDWTVRALAPGAVPAEGAVVAERGTVAELELAVS